MFKIPEVCERKSCLVSWKKSGELEESSLKHSIVLPNENFLEQ